MQVIITVASKISQDVGTNWKPTAYNMDVQNMAPMRSLTKVSVGLRSPSKTLRVMVDIYWHA